VQPSTTAVMQHASGINPELGLVIGILGLVLGILTLIVSIVVFWIKMGNVLGYMSKDVSVIKEHVNVSATRQEKLRDDARHARKKQEQHFDDSAQHDKRLGDLTLLFSQQQITLGYMEKVFSEIKILVDNNTSIAKDLKSLLEAEYAKHSK
jgi:hypothetical protein